MKKLFSFLLLTLLSANLFSAPVVAADAEANAPDRFLAGLSQFITRISPENAGNFILFSAMFAMNPQNTAVNPAQPIRCALILTDPEQNIIPILSVSIKPEMIPPERCIPWMGIAWNIIREKNGRALLSPKNLQVDPKWDQLDPILTAKNVFQKNTPGLLLRLHRPAILYSAQFLQESLPEKTIGTVIADAKKELDILSLKIFFPSSGKLILSGNAKLRKDSRLRFSSKQNRKFSFQGFHSFQGADHFLSAALPGSTELKRRILSAADRMGIPYFLQEFIMRSNGTLFSAWNADICKFTIELEKGAAQILERNLKEERNITPLPSGILRLSPIYYLRLKDDRAVFVSGAPSEAAALKIMKDETPLPAAPQPYLAGGIIGRTGKPVRRFFLKPDPNGNVQFEWNLEIEDFPKQEIRH